MIVTERKTVGNMGEPREGMKDMPTSGMKPGKIASK
jgi:hypothetical protein